MSSDLIMVSTYPSKNLENVTTPADSALSSHACLLFINSFIASQTLLNPELNPSWIKLNKFTKPSAGPERRLNWLTFAILFKNLPSSLVPLPHPFKEILFIISLNCSLSNRIPKMLPFEVGSLYALWNKFNIACLVFGLFGVSKIERSNWLIIFRLSIWDTVSPI